MLSREKRGSALRILAALPAVALLLALFSFTEKAPAPETRFAADAVSRIDMNGIVSVNIIKESALTRIYGDKASNGVVLITTKNAPKRETAVMTGVATRADSIVFGKALHKGIGVAGTDSINGRRIAIRRAPSLAQSDPMVIIDGKIIDKAVSSEEILNEVPLETIQAITILKDAASTALYGAQAANGVIVIETKSSPARRVISGEASIPMPHRGIIVTSPAFWGGDVDEFQHWVQNRLSKSTRKAIGDYRVTVSFVVDADGSVKNVKTIRSFPGYDGKVDQEIKRILKSSPTWEPGTRNREKAATPMTLQLTGR